MDSSAAVDALQTQLDVMKTSLASIQAQQARSSPAPVDSSAAVDALQSQLDKMKTTLALIQAQQASSSPSLAAPVDSAAVDALQSQLDEMKTSLALIQAQQASFSPSSAAPLDSSTAADALQSQLDEIKASLALIQAQHASSPTSTVVDTLQSQVKDARTAILSIASAIELMKSDFEDWKSRPDVDRIESVFSDNSHVTLPGEKTRQEIMIEKLGYKSLREGVVIHEDSPSSSAVLMGEERADLLPQPPLTASSAQSSDLDKIVTQLMLKVQALETSIESREAIQPSSQHAPVSSLFELQLAELSDKVASLQSQSKESQVIPPSPPRDDKAPPRTAHGQVVTGVGAQKGLDLSARLDEFEKLVWSQIASQEKTILYVSGFVQKQLKEAAVKGKGAGMGEESSVLSRALAVLSVETRNTIEDLR